MITGLYNAASAMEMASARHELTAENLASAQMPGFRRRLILQEAFEQELESQALQGGADQPQDANAAARAITHDWTQGRIEETGRPLDVAIDGDAFFSVAGPEGPLYTRNGTFQVSAQGQLVTHDQLPVLGSGGAITLPSGARTASIHILPDGRMLSNGVEFAQLALTRFDNPEQLTPAGATLFAAPDEAGPREATARVMQGYQELSNVSTVTELADMVNNMRQYEAAQKALNAIAEAMQKRIGLR